MRNLTCDSSQLWLDCVAIDVDGVQQFNAVRLNDYFDSFVNSERLLSLGSLYLRASSLIT